MPERAGCRKRGVDQRDAPGAVAGLIGPESWKVDGSRVPASLPALARGLQARQQRPL